MTLKTSSHLFSGGGCGGGSISLVDTKHETDRGSGFTRQSLQWCKAPNEEPWKSDFSKLLSWLREWGVPEFFEALANIYIYIYICKLLFETYIFLSRFFP